MNLAIFMRWWCWEALSARIKECARTRSGSPETLEQGSGSDGKPRAVRTSIAADCPESESESESGSESGSGSESLSEIIIGHEADIEPRVGEEGGRRPMKGGRPRELGAAPLPASSIGMAAGEERGEPGREFAIEQLW